MVGTKHWAEITFSNLLTSLEADLKIIVSSRNDKTAPDNDPNRHLKLASFHNVISNLGIWSIPEKSHHNRHSPNAA
jgi:hypothetical protein